MDRFLYVRLYGCIYVCVNNEFCQILQRAAELSPEEGHMKFLYLAQLGEGETAVGHLTTAISIMTREREGGMVSMEEISRAYCSLAEIYLTDAWSVANIS